MKLLRRHLVRCFVAGVVALLPIVGLVSTVVYFENLVAVSWLKQQGFYFFGLGLLMLIVVVYLTGLAVTNVFGRWLWSKTDWLLDQMPILGSLYQTLKQILGYSSGPDGLFRRVVLVSVDEHRWEIGMVTREPEAQGDGLLTVFLPSAPNPMNGRIILIHPDRTQSSSLSVNEALRELVSLGATER